MSVREKRSEALKLLKQQRQLLRAEQSRLEQQGAGLDEAIADLEREPRIITESVYEMEFARLQLMVNAGRCSECKERTFGREPNWTGCPVCLSKFSKVTQESDPWNRHQRELVEAGVNELKTSLTQGEANNGR